MRLSVWLAGALSILLLASGCRLAGGERFPAQAPSIDAGIASYVALGDSYTTGGDIGDSSGFCLRSSQDYPSLIAERLGIYDFHDASCGGATTADLTESQQRTNGSNPPQTRWLNETTSLVTLGIGMNDGGLASKVGYACLRTTTEVPAACDALLRISRQQMNEAVRANAARVQGSLATIRSLAPHARIVLVGYPRLLPDGRTCPDRLPLDLRAVGRVRDVLREVNVVWKRVAQAAGALYVDTYSASQGHDVCSRDPWINGLTPKPGHGAILHPNAEYHSAVATLVLEVLQGKQRFQLSSERRHGLSDVG